MGLWADWGWIAFGSQLNNGTHQSLSLCATVASGTREARGQQLVMSRSREDGEGENTGDEIDRNGDRNIDWGRREMFTSTDVVEDVVVVVFFQASTLRFRL